MRRHLSARSRLTLLYTVMFALGGAALILITYGLARHSVHAAASTSPTQETQQAIAQCVTAAQNAGSDSSALAEQKCSGLYANGVLDGASAQRNTILTYALLSLATMSLLAAIAGWVTAGRILGPIHRITAAARTASEQDLSHRIALQGPRDELRELADTFDTMLDRLEHAFTNQRQFIANASHELRTPLTVMRTAIDVVLAKPRPTPDELTSMTTEIRDAVGHADRLIDALLILARTDQAQTRTEPLDLATIVEDALEGRSPGDDITTSTTLGRATVTGNSVLLERLVANLLDNAERYNRPGGTIDIATSSTDTTSVLRVVNTGAMVPADMVQRLFQPFTRLHDRTRHEGFGLGLALVASIAAAHGGVVDATALPTGGLDITIRLPRRDLRPPADDRRASS